MKFEEFARLAVVVAVTAVGLLAYGLGIFPPRLGLATEKAKQVNCAGNLKQIGLALIIYAGDDYEKGHFPSGATFELLHLEGYLPNGKVYACPTLDGISGTRTARASSYVYRGAGLTNRMENSGRTILAHDRIVNHLNFREARPRWRKLAKVHRGGWVNVLFADGRVAGVQVRSIAEFEKACRAKGWFLPDE